MHIVNDIATRNNISNVTSFVYITSKKHTSQNFYIECYRMHNTVLITNCQKLVEPAEDKLTIHRSLA